ncbi:MULTISPECIES: HAD family hydrolase [Acetobacter]|uniref:HAD family hydrolase n=1 Tax=Acetobacter TaxID=434 RepID=UPI00376FD105
MIRNNFSQDTWRDIDLVCFDVDGTLYDQRKLRLFMLREILMEVSQTRKVNFIRILKIYRSLREKAIAYPNNFEQLLISETANLAGCSENTVKDIITEWIHIRPLRYLDKCRYAGVIDLFSRLKSHGKKIGIFSDYPAENKIISLGLKADYIVYAGDKDTPRLKPDPQGLLNIMQMSGSGPANTLLIGDRPERDGIAARKAESYVLLRSTKKYNDFQTFNRYTESIFSLNS